VKKRFSGVTNTKSKTVTISPESIDDYTVLLHEMIHAYEDLLNSTKPFSRDILLLCLYNHLKEKIDNLDDMIIEHGTSSQSHVTVHVVSQTFLFML
jgi:hypothetical protein